MFTSSLTSQFVERGVTTPRYIRECLSATLANSEVIESDSYVVLELAGSFTLARIQEMVAHETQSTVWAVLIQVLKLSPVAEPYRLPKIEPSPVYPSYIVIPIEVIAFATVSDSHS